ncbi:MAG: hypothetical protein ABF379_01520, partial [Akkermansiaceae bacterium]
MSKPKATATAFSQFVFEQTTGIKSAGGSRSDSDYQRWTGTITEANMRQYRAVASQAGRCRPETEWKIAVEDQGKTDNDIVFDCRGLTVQGQPLRCRPDLVLRTNPDNPASPVIIVERKVRTDWIYGAVPDLAWPNVRAQLWCYAWITDWDWLQAGRVVLMTEYFWRPHPEFGDPVYMGCRGVWSRSDWKFNKEAAEHFEAYGGSISEQLQMP